MPTILCPWLPNYWGFVDFLTRPVAGSSSLLPGGTSWGFAGTGPFSCHRCGLVPILSENGEAMSARALALSVAPTQLQQASELTDFSNAIGLPVTEEFAALLPWPVLRRGTTLSITTGASAGATSLLLALLAQASASGAWCAVIGASEVYPSAAAQAGVSLSRLALVTDPGEQWESVTAALLDGVDIVAVNTTTNIMPRQAQRLAARARKRGALLVPFGPGTGSWPKADVVFSVGHVRWHGLRRGSGQLRHCQLQVASRCHGRVAKTTIWPYGKPADISGESSLASVTDLNVHRRRQGKEKASAGIGRALSRMG